MAYRASVHDTTKCRSVSVALEAISSPVTVANGQLLHILGLGTVRICIADVEFVHQALIAKRWDEFLPELLMAYRASVHDTTKFTPFHLMFGREIRLPIELLAIPVWSMAIPMN